MAVLETKNLTMQYRGRTALDRVSLALEPGRIYGLVGQTGAGKSTLFHILAGFLTSTAGTYSLLGGTSSEENRQNRAQVGFLLADPGLPEGMTALQHLLSIQRLRGYRDRAEALELLAQLGLEGSPATRQHIATFSMGQKQRTALAAALLQSPKLLVLDEPLAGLDPEAAAQFRQLLEARRDQGVTVLISSQTPETLNPLATDLLFLQAGKLENPSNISS
jgi:ABC-2 type transport system ATP-binding protein